jgi:hypothetical protein
VIAAVDRYVLPDTLEEDSPFLVPDVELLEALPRENALNASEGVTAEVSSALIAMEAVETIIADLSITPVPFGMAAAVPAHGLFRAHRQGGGRRGRVRRDSPAVEHAPEHAHALVARERRFDRGDFAEWRVIDPSE